MHLAMAGQTWPGFQDCLAAGLVSRPGEGLGEISSHAVWKEVRRGKEKEHSLLSPLQSEVAHLPPPPPLPLSHSVSVSLSLHYTPGVSRETLPNTDAGRAEKALPTYTYHHAHACTCGV